MKKRNAGRMSTDRRSLMQRVEEQAQRIEALEHNLFLVSEVVKMHVQRFEIVSQFGERSLARVDLLEAPQVKMGLVVLN